MTNLPLNDRPETVRRPLNGAMNSKSSTWNIFQVNREPSQVKGILQERRKRRPPFLCSPSRQVGACDDLDLTLGKTRASGSVTKNRSSTHTVPASLNFSVSPRKRSGSVFRIEEVEYATETRRCREENSPGISSLCLRVSVALPTARKVLHFLPRRNKGFKPHHPSISRTKSTVNYIISPFCAFYIQWHFSCMYTGFIAVWTYRCLGLFVVEP